MPYLVGSKEAGGISVNSQYRPNGRGGRVLTDMAVRYRDEIILAVKSARLVAPEARTLALRLRFVPPADGKLRDADNLIKPTADALALAFGWPNDNRIALTAVERVDPDSANPRIEIELTALTGGKRHGAA